VAVEKIMDLTTHGPCTRKQANKRKAIIQGASYYGIPLSTTHVITTSIMGVGAVKRFSGMRWTVVERIIWAWLFTLPASGLIGFALERVATAAF
jgi:PiT family inorganic phosphate transporter